MDIILQVFSMLSAIFLIMTAYTLFKWLKLKFLLKKITKIEDEEGPERLIKAKKIKRLSFILFWISLVMFIITLIPVYILVFNNLV